MRPARAVLEIAGGEAKRLGLQPGQQVNHPALGTARPLAHYRAHLGSAMIPGQLLGRKTP